MARTSAAKAETPPKFEPSRVAPEKLAWSSSPWRVSCRTESSPLRGCGMAIWPSRKSAPVRSAPDRLAPRKVAPRISARVRRAWLRSALRKLQPNRLARISRAPFIRAPSKEAPVKSASDSSRPTRSSPDRSAKRSDRRRPPGLPATNRSWPLLMMSSSAWLIRRRGPSVSTIVCVRASDGPSLTVEPRRAVKNGGPGPAPSLQRRFCGRRLHNPLR